MIGQTVCDSDHIIESMRKMIEEEEDDSTRDRFESYDDFELNVYETEARMVALPYEEMQERNLVEWSDQIFTLEFKVMKIGGLKLTLKFHENIVDHTISLTPAGPNAIDPVQATQPEVLSSKLEKPIGRINRVLDVNSWDLCEIDGASIANGGYITDYEFEYDAFCKDPTKL